jgi:hypothetical protein
MHTAVTFVLACLLAVPVSAQEENTGSNRNILREWAGSLRMQTIADKRYRGVEEWRMFVHGDGSRTMMLSKDFLAFNALQIMTMRVEANFRPADVYAAYWVPDGYRGAIRVAIDGDRLRAVSEGPGPAHTETHTVPEEIAVITHGESMNGWYLWQGDPKSPEPQALHEFNLIPVGPAGENVRGILRTGSYEYLGPETVTVPAGTFEAERYRIMNIELWITGEDRILVKQVIAEEDKEYVLTRLEAVSQR